jgi:hypothetical protein
VGCDEGVVRQKGRYASGRGYGQVRLSVVLSKRQWRVRESWVSAWAESSVRTHTPGPTTGLAMKEHRGPMAEGTWTRKSGHTLLRHYWPSSSSGRRMPTSSSLPKPPPGADCFPLFATPMLVGALDGASPNPL